MSISITDTTNNEQSVKSNDAVTVLITVTEKSDCVVNCKLLCHTLYTRTLLIRSQLVLVTSCQSVVKYFSHNTSLQLLLLLNGFLFISLNRKTSFPAFSNQSRLWSFECTRLNEEKTLSTPADEAVGSQQLLLLLLLLLLDCHL